MENKSLKIFVTGFFNSGKSTLVHTLDNKAIHVEKELKKAYDKEKTTTTTGIDLGRMVWVRPNLTYETEGVIMSKTEFLRDKGEYLGWHLNNFELKGSPGQMQFSTVRKILARGSDGVIFLIDGSDVANIGNGLVIMEEIKAVLGPDIPMKIIANKSDREDYQGGEMISNLVGEQVYEGSGKFNIGVKDAIIAILKMIANSDNGENKTEMEAVV